MVGQTTPLNGSYSTYIGQRAVGGNNVTFILTPLDLSSSSRPAW